MVILHSYVSSPKGNTCFSFDIGMEFIRLSRLDKAGRPRLGDLVIFRAFRLSIWSQKTTLSIHPLKMAWVIVVPSGKLT